MIEVRGRRFAGLGFLFAMSCGLLYAASALAQGAAPAGKAAVFIYRSDRTPVPAPVPVTVNAERAGDLAHGTFIVAIVAPGKVFLRAGDRILSSLSLQAAANRNYFVRLEATSALLPVRTQMRQVSESAARGPLRGSRFVGRGAAAEAAAKKYLGAAPAVARAPAAPRAAPSAPPPPAPRVAQAAPPPPAPRAAPAPAAVSPAAESGWDVAVIAKGGAFKLSDSTQVIGTFPSTYQTTSPAASLELEWRSRDGLAVGGEVFYHKNKVTNDVNGQTGERTVVSFFLNGKYYFRATDWFYPFAGIGVGGATASYGGGLSGKASGVAYQGMAGTEFRFGNVGLYLEYKYLASTTDDGTGNKAKVGGNGAFAGLSLIF